MSKGTILIVEDQPGFRRIYRDVLASEGYEVLQAEDGQTGWEMAKSNKPGLVLLDLGLPKMDGFEVLTRIRADAEVKHIPVIIFSVLGEQKDVKKGLELGANDYTVKGFYTPRQILSKIKNLMNQSQSKPTINSYKVNIADSKEDASKLQGEVGIPQNFSCPQCSSAMVLELFPDYVRSDGHWFTARFTCPKCGKFF